MQSFIGAKSTSKMTKNQTNYMFYSLRIMSKMMIILSDLTIPDNS